MELYKQIKRYRTDMNLSQEELAEKIYVTRQTISNWENDKSYPDIHSLLLLSSTFHISLDQLIKISNAEYFIGVSFHASGRFPGYKVQYELSLYPSSVHHRTIPVCLYSLYS